MGFGFGRSSSIKPGGSGLGLPIKRGGIGSKPGGWGGRKPFVGGNPATWSPVPTVNPLIDPSNPFTELIKKLESVIPSSNPQHASSKSPEISGKPLTNYTSVLILAQVFGASYPHHDYHT
jgi:hypothetical protein